MQLDALSAEKEALSSAVRQREADLQAAQSLVQEKEAVLSRERQHHSQEREELQGGLAGKVGPPLCDNWLESHGPPVVSGQVRGFWVHLALLGHFHHCRESPP